MGDSSTRDPSIDELLGGNVSQETVRLALALAVAMKNKSDDECKALMECLSAEKPKVEQKDQIDHQDPANASLEFPNGTDEPTGLGNADEKVAKMDSEQQIRDILDDSGLENGYPKHQTIEKDLKVEELHRSDAQSILEELRSGEDANDHADNPSADKEVIEECISSDAMDPLRSEPQDSATTNLEFSNGTDEPASLGHANMDSEKEIKDLLDDSGLEKGYPKHQPEEKDSKVEECGGSDGQSVQDEQRSGEDDDEQADNQSASSGQANKEVDEECISSDAKDRLPSGGRSVQDEQRSGEDDNEQADNRSASSGQANKEVDEECISSDAKDRLPSDGRSVQDEQRSGEDDNEQADNQSASPGQANKEVDEECISSDAKDRLPSDGRSVQDEQRSGEDDNEQADNQSASPGQANKEVDEECISSDAKDPLPSEPQVEDHHPPEEKQSNDDNCHINDAHLVVADGVLSGEIHPQKLHREARDGVEAMTNEEGKLPSVVKFTSLEDLYPEHSQLTEGELVVAEPQNSEADHEKNDSLDKDDTLSSASSESESDVTEGFEPTLPREHQRLSATLESDPAPEPQLSTLSDDTVAEIDPDDTSVRAYEGEFRGGVKAEHKQSGRETPNSSESDQDDSLSTGVVPQVAMEKPLQQQLPQPLAELDLFIRTSNALPVCDPTKNLLYYQPRFILDGTTPVLVLQPVTHNFSGSTSGGSPSDTPTNESGVPLRIPIYSPGLNTAQRAPIDSRNVKDSDGMSGKRERQQSASPPPIPPRLNPVCSKWETETISSTSRSDSEESNILAQSNSGSMEGVGDPENVLTVPEFDVNDDMPVEIEKLNGTITPPRVSWPKGISSLDVFSSSSGTQGIISSSFPTDVPDCDHCTGYGYARPLSSSNPFVDDVAALSDKKGLFDTKGEHFPAVSSQETDNNYTLPTQLTTTTAAATAPGAKQKVPVQPQAEPSSCTRKPNGNPFSPLEPPKSTQYFQEPPNMNFSEAVPIRGRMSSAFTPTHRETTSTSRAPLTSVQGTVAAANVSQVREDAQNVSGGQPLGGQESSLVKKPVPGLVAPFWVRDVEVSNCAYCTVKFTVMRRKHHCRGCGKIFCSGCCSQLARLPYLQYNIARICIVCTKDVREALKNSKKDRNSSNNAGRQNLPKRQAPTTGTGLHGAGMTPSLSTSSSQQQQPGRTRVPAVQPTAGRSGVVAQVSPVETTPTLSVRQTVFAPVQQSNVAPKQMAAISLTAPPDQLPRQVFVVGARQPAPTVGGGHHVGGTTPQGHYHTRAPLSNGKGTSGVVGQVPSAKPTATSSVGHVMLVPVQQPGPVMYMSPSYMYAPAPQTLHRLPLQQNYSPVSPAQSQVLLLPGQSFTPAQSAGTPPMQHNEGRTDAGQFDVRSGSGGANTKTMFTTLPQHVGQSAVQNAETTRQEQQARRASASSGLAVTDPHSISDQLHSHPYRASSSTQTLPSSTSNSWQQETSGTTGALQPITPTLVPSSGQREENRMPKVAAETQMSLDQNPTGNSSGTSSEAVSVGTVRESQGSFIVNEDRRDTTPILKSPLRPGGKTISWTFKTVDRSKEQRKLLARDLKALPNGVSILTSEDLLIHIKKMKLKREPKALELWCFHSEGFRKFHHEEVVLLLEVLPKEDVFPEELLRVFRAIFFLLKMGHSFKHGQYLASNSTFLDNKENAGFLFVSSELQPKMEGVKDIRSPFLYGILVKRPELPCAIYTPTRLLLRLGLAAKCFPFPLWNNRNREPVYHGMNEDDRFFNTICAMNKYLKISVPEAMIPGLFVVKEGNKIILQLPHSSHPVIDNLLDRLMVKDTQTATIPLLSDISPFVDSFAVLTQEVHGKGVNVFQNAAVRHSSTDPNVSGRGFLLLHLGVGASSSLEYGSELIDDGVLISLSKTDTGRLRNSLRERTNRYLYLGDRFGIAHFELRWAQDQRQSVPFTKPPPTVTSSLPVKPSYPGPRPHSGVASTLNRAFETGTPCAKPSSPGVQSYPGHGVIRVRHTGLASERVAAQLIFGNADRVVSDFERRINDVCELPLMKQANKMKPGETTALQVRVALEPGHRSWSVGPANLPKALARSIQMTLASVKTPFEVFEGKLELSFDVTIQKC